MILNLLFNEVGILEVSPILLEHAALVVHGAALSLVFLVHTLLPGEMISNVTHIDLVYEIFLFIIT